MQEGLVYAGIVGAHLFGGVGEVEFDRSAAAGLEVDDQRPARLAHLTKILGNFMLLSTIETLGEAFAVARKAGLPPATFLDAMTGSVFAAPLYRNWGKLRDAQAAVGYLRTAVVNGSRSVLRRRKTAREYVPPHAVNARSAESLAMLSNEHQAVVSALSKLPPRQREVLVLRYYGGLSEAEISEAAGISKGTVKSTASRALESLQKAMSG